MVYKGIEPSYPTRTSPQRAACKSHALRASVLDAALELGIASNGTVAKWMFSNAIDEGDEDEKDSLPSLTYASTPEDSPTNTLVETSQTIEQFLKSNLSSYPPLNPAMPLSAVDDMIPPISNNPKEPTTNTPGSKRLLKKKGESGPALNNGAYESDRGSKSQGVKKQNNKDSDSAAALETKRLKEEKQRAKEAKKLARKESGYDTDGSSAMSSLRRAMSKKQKASSQNGTDTDASRTLSPLRRVMSSKKLNVSSQNVSETESSPSKSPLKRTKSKKQKEPSQDGYETDDGYVSSASQTKKKSRFFRLGNRSKGDLDDSSIPPVPQQPVPALPSTPLPIAGQFATRHAAESETSLQISSTTASLRSTTVDSNAKVRHVPGLEVNENLSHSSSTSASLAKTRSSHSVDLPNAAPVTASPSKRTAVVRFQDDPFVVHSPTRSISPPLFVPSYPSQALSSLHSSPSSFTALLSPSSSPRPPSTPSGSRPISPSGPHLILRENHEPEAKHIPSPLILPHTPYTNTTLVSPNKVFYPLPVSPRPPAAGGSTSSPQSKRLGRVQTGTNVTSPSEMLAAFQSNPSSTPSNPPPQTPSLLVSPSRYQQRALSPSPSPGSPQRGKIAPFPTKPNSNEASPTLSMESRVRVRRYKDLYGVPSTPTGGWQTREPPPPVERARPQHQEQSTNPGIQVEEASDDEAANDGRELLRVIQRWRLENKQDEADDERVHREPMVARSRSIGLPSNVRRRDVATMMARDAPDAPESVRDDDDDDRSLYSDDETNTGTYGVEHGVNDADDYPRRSFLDNAKSQRVRAAFVGNVEAEYDEAGREKVTRATPMMNSKVIGTANSTNSYSKKRGLPPGPRVPDGWF